MWEIGNEAYPKPFIILIGWFRVLTYKIWLDTFECFILSVTNIPMILRKKITYLLLFTILIFIWLQIWYLNIVIFSIDFLVLQEHRTLKPIKSKDKSPIQQRTKARNRYSFCTLLLFKLAFRSYSSLKDFICDSSCSSDEEKEHPLEFYPKIDRLIDRDISWRQ